MVVEFIGAQFGSHKASTFQHSDAFILPSHSEVFSLQAAIFELNKRRNSGWWPDWNEQLAAIPKDWDTVAAMMMNVVCSSISESKANSNISNSRLPLKPI